MSQKIKYLFLFSFLLLLAALIFPGCGRKDTPRSVAEKYLAALSSQDFEKAREYGTDETINLLNMMIALKKMSADSSFKEVKYEILKEEVSGDNATVFYKEDGREGTLELPLVKIDDQWKVILTKESFNNSDPSLDIGATSMDSSSLKGK
jgi:hypothetical protein